ncbi:DNA alkylation repair protein [Flavihumibacter stibioxidans]|uniref:DNA alkylation repair protein n=1 Tax=Flavihumibacter stibioxidans TaxID=1834163 RepID=A0ABR7M407_9BACT|nr:DNA alkylation repair protein [Flavihumibacter stibioxidans]MBC6489707.1 DNA alkylation repair protein [Flavihumibacter stibioxidans]
MATLLKDLYSPFFYQHLATVLETTVPGFDKKQYIRLVFDQGWEEKELKARMRHTATTLHRFMPANFSEAAPIFETIVRAIALSPISKASLECMFLADYIEQYGLAYFDESVRAMELTTGLSSCEFAIRPFILQYGERMMVQMKLWSLHRDHHVRRLASEGCRPRLPWAIALSPFKKNPAPILPILENLKTDPSEYVRRSVANNLNDIAKDNPEIILAIARKWKGLCKETDAIIKHGCRSLLKQGHPEILDYYGLKSHQLQLQNLRIHTPKVNAGEDLSFSFTLVNQSGKTTVIRLEYAIYFLRQNGSHSKKVFKISEKQVAAGDKVTIHRKQSFRPITTRKYYPGRHRVSVIMNGKEFDALPFELK